MSKSVDETVFDFFDVLLKEPSQEVQTSVATEVSSIATEPSGKASTLESVSFKKQNSKTIPKPNLRSNPVVNTQPSKSLSPDIKKDYAEPQVDKAALSKLLSAVSKPVIKHQQKQSAVEGALTSSKTVSAEKTQQQIQDEIKSKAQQVRQQLGQVIAEDDVIASGKTLSSLDNKESEISADIIVDNVEITANQTNINEGAASSKRNILDKGMTQASSVPPSITRNLQDVLDDEFQVLFFNVAGLTLAVPLVSLGGIVKIEHINHLIGRPDWFLGVQTRREQKVNVVDSCRWVMPEKYTKELADSIDYQYLVMLEDSNWGLACESLVNAVRIDKSHVNWREKPGKRPWLAGVVKEQMCGILNVQALIEMLDAGLGCQDSID